MEQKIKEVQEYFTAKILADEFEITSKTEHTWNILIDGKYKFEIWMANDRDYREPTNMHGGQFMELKFTTAQKHRLDSLLSKRKKEYEEKILLVEKRKQFDQLKRELGE